MAGAGVSGLHIHVGPSGAYIRVPPIGVHVHIPSGMHICMGPSGVYMRVPPSGVHIRVDPSGVHVHMGPSGVHVRMGLSGVHMCMAQHVCPHAWVRQVCMCMCLCQVCTRAWVRLACTPFGSVRCAHARGSVRYVHTCASVRCACTRGPVRCVHMCASIRCARACACQVCPCVWARQVCTSTGSLACSTALSVSPVWPPWPCSSPESDRWASHAFLFCQSRPCVTLGPLQVYMNLGISLSVSTPKSCLCRGTQSGLGDLWPACLEPRGSRRALDEYESCNWELQRDSVSRINPTTVQRVPSGLRTDLSIRTWWQDGAGTLSKMFGR